MDRIAPWILGACLTVAAGCGDALSGSEPSPDDGWEYEETQGAGAGAESCDAIPREYYALRKPTLRRVARSTAVLVDRDRLGERRSSEQATVESRPNGRCNLGFGANQPAPGLCTGFLVGPRTLVTAGHCIRNRPECEATSAVFDFLYETPSDDVRTVTRGDVYACRRISHRRDSSAGVDFSVVQLDRPVRDRPPLQIGGGTAGRPGRSVAIVGAPGGLPVKAFTGGRTVARDAGLLEYELPTFPGHAGSPVVDPETGRVLAIHARGDSDRADGPCRRDADRPHPAGTRALRLVPHLGPPLREGRRTFRPRYWRGRGPEFYIPSHGGVETVELELTVRSRSTVSLRAARRLPGIGGETYSRTIETPPDREPRTIGWELDSFDDRSARGIWEVTAETDASRGVEIRDAALDVEIGHSSDGSSTARRSR